MRRIIAALAIFVSVGSLTIPALPAIADEFCKDYLLIGARGTGEKDDHSDPRGEMGPEANALFSALQPLVLEGGKSIDFRGVHYPATKDNDAGSVYRRTDAYMTSVAEGASDVLSVVQDVHAQCTDTHFILAGHSQGAEVIANSINIMSIQKSWVAATFLTGDPMFNPGDTTAVRGSFDRKHFGLYGPRDVWGTKITSPVFSYCLYADFVCNSKKWIAARSATVLGEDWDFAVSHNGGDLFSIHATYPIDIAPRAAKSVAQALGFGCGSPMTGSRQGSISLLNTVHVGEPVSINGRGIQWNDCDNLQWRWWAHRETPSASRGVQIFIDDEEEEEPPIGVGPYLDTTFAEAGNYTITMRVEAADGPITVQETINVLPEETEAPLPPLLTVTTLDNDRLLLAWTADGSDSPGTAYQVTDPTGAEIAAVIPVWEEGIDGIENYEFVVDDADLDNPLGYSVTAFNEIGSTPALLETPTIEAAYVHRTHNGAVTTGGVLTLTGPMTEPLEAMKDAHPSGSVALDGGYTAVLHHESESIPFDMSALDAELTFGGDDWTATINIGDTVDLDGNSVSSQLRGGFASDLLAGGRVDVQADGYGFGLVISEETETSEENRYVLDTNASVPNGVTADEYGGGSSQSGIVELAHNGSYDPDLFPVSTEINNLDTYEWSTAEISDVRAYAGARELTFDGDVWINGVADATSVSDNTIALEIDGKIGDGTYTTMQSFLRDGAISFRVDGGSVNVMTLDASTQIAEDLFPPATAPAFNGDDIVSADEGEFLYWDPYSTIDWGTEGWGWYEITMDDVPDGIDAYADSIRGVPTEGGSFPFTVTATNSTGTTTHEFTLIVYSKSLQASEATYVHQTSTHGTVSGATLSLTGEMTPNLLRALNGQTVEDFSLAGNYTAELTATDDATLSLDMSSVDGLLNTTQHTWNIDIPFADSVDSDGIPVWQRMRDGLAQSLLAGGTITLTIGQTEFHVQITAQTQVQETNRYILDPDAEMPDGVSLDEMHGNAHLQNIELIKHGTYSPALFPASSEVTNPEEFDWSSAVISDVHVYVAGQEVTATGGLSLYTANAPTTTDDYSIYAIYQGKIGDGKYPTLRHLLEDGAITFRVNDGAINVLEMHTTEAQAELEFPTPTLPEFLGSDVIHVPVYSNFTVDPQIDWGIDYEGTRVITEMPGARTGGFTPSGSWSGSYDTQGTYQFLVSATNDAGTSYRTFTLVIGPSVAAVQLTATAGNINRTYNGDLSIHLLWYGYVRQDNATMIQFLPALGESGIGVDQSTQFTATDFKMYLADGTVVPITGTFVVTMPSSQGPSFLDISSTNARIGDNTSATVNSVWKQSNKFTFRRSSGALNEFWKGGFLSQTLP